MPLDALKSWRSVLTGYLSSQGRPVVDVGSGTGQFARAFAEWFPLDVVGVEPSTGMRYEARCLTLHPRVSYVAGRAEAIPLKERSGGCAWLSTVTHHITNLRACARELRRVLIPGGPVLIRSAFPGRLGRISQFRYFPEARRAAETFPSIQHIADTFGCVGFTLEHVQDVPQVSAPTLRTFLHRAREGRHADSTLAVLTNEEFERGILALERAVAVDTAPVPVVDYLTLLVLR